MPNRQLTPEELKALFSPLLDDVRGKLKSLSGGNAGLLFALWRKLAKELSYDERSKPMQRKVLKAAKCAEKLGKCANCGGDLEKLEKNAVLDRTEATKGVMCRKTCACCATRATASRKLSATTRKQPCCRVRCHNQSAGLIVMNAQIATPPFVSNVKPNLPSIRVARGVPLFSKT